MQERNLQHTKENSILETIKQFLLLKNTKLSKLMNFGGQRVKDSVHNKWNYFLMNPTEKGCPTIFNAAINIFAINHSQ